MSNLRIILGEEFYALCFIVIVAAIYVGFIFLRSYIRRVKEVRRATRLG